MRSTIRQLREAKGLSQKELAERLGTSQVTLSGWETGRHVPNGTHLQQLAAALEVPMGDIAFGGEVRMALRAQVRSIILEAAASQEHSGVWRTDAGVFVRDRFAPVERLFTGIKPAFVDYCNREGELTVVPIGTQRRGMRQTAVWKFPVELPV